ncbi:MAG: MoaD/ThiS family protein [Oscillatoriales cyanobacterium]|jgi:sulfur-carrier protein|nr:MAG: MoaD/ThiS family protein [Oscillatoriales cyanobacterium]
MVDSSISITIKFFAAYQDAYGLPEVVWSFPEGTIVADVLERCVREHPPLESLRSQTRFGINLEFVEPSTVLADNDEVVLIPPVSGG